MEKASLDPVCWDIPSLVDTMASNMSRNKSILPLHAKFKSSLVEVPFLRKILAVESM